MLPTDTPVLMIPEEGWGPRGERSRSICFQPAHEARPNLCNHSSRWKELSRSWERQEQPGAGRAVGNELLL